MASRALLTGAVTSCGRTVDAAAEHGIYISKGVDFMVHIYKFMPLARCAEPPEGNKFPFALVKPRASGVWARSDARDRRGCRRGLARTKFGSFTSAKHVRFMFFARPVYLRVWVYGATAVRGYTPAASGGNQPGAS